ncbi:hypothetical protein A3E96_02505 [Candidatus Uhrbacteria bacterium RIFCSPHIGHO2_12_FULL_46_13]|uniref:Uncharacterized protein n=1 Tax=Candidatus Uhrbacteria bacterium RIFCSPLOWO2_01_FULL_47_25 TaxID=1802402 RepID=A0A1F7UT54_9BACT|nr:MAG: hypothetical protein UX68_C0015G0004 [Parcubacteria group bacterium GW2011_GWA2_46_9]OGL59897.1 MAG: hypothetical protein A2752_04115 [Candidatus Uhrbacteria bacterium RIFCSPHIGHO2_01_FULL_46_23]OGL69448.1 MAG: hypothetical protein A3D60_03185 [Candidatus Uhrbacteria bacterium RIFCSPHIGHO2_02_FULL_47_29]OGL75360.1 MAG: hypothetical protein A3E96_02505 [Candidatus Uhrbacteria bacterium RIFCSPHIGHO2_12_FULL_46_13]OGL80904.1 MAG: hypothetical protein A2936_05750 [Candidatus Uhrbacteria bac
MSDRLRPIPDAVLLPEERAAFKASGQSKLPGAPEAAYESVLVAREEELPLDLMSTVGSDLDRFLATTRAEDQRAVQRERFQELLRNPTMLENYFDMARILEERWQERRGDLARYQAVFLDNMDRTDFYSHEVAKQHKDAPTYTPKTLGAWLRLCVKSNVFRSAAEKIMRGLYTANTRDPESAVDFIYAFTEAILEADDQETFMQGLRQLCGDTDVFPSGSLGEKNMLRASVTTDNDPLLERFMAVDAVMSEFGRRYLPDAYTAMQARNKKLAGDPKKKDGFLVTTVERGLKKDPGKLRSLIGLYERPEGLNEISAKDFKRWPFTLTTGGGRVRTLFNERIAAENERFVSLSLPNTGKILYRDHPSEVLREIISRDLRQSPVAGEEVLSVPEQLTSLYYLAPDLDRDQVRLLVDANDVLRHELFEQRVHSVSPRGDKMLVVDPELQALGVRSIVFALGDPRTRITVTVEAFNYYFVFALNEDTDFEVVGARQPLPGSFERRAFLEHMVLSHLKELQCTDRVVAGVSVNAHSGNLERQQEFTDRRGHLRKLPPGQGYSETQRRLALDEQGWDIVRINAELSLTKTQGMKTYVGIIDQVAIGGREPLLSRAPHAMDRYHELITSTEGAQYPAVSKQ